MMRAEGETTCTFVVSDTASDELNASNVRERESMALPIESTKPAPASALKILAKSFYKELRGSGYEERDVVALAGELLSLVTKDVKARRESDEGIAFLPKK